MDSDVRIISSDETLAAGGHYSPGVSWERLVFVSGQLPVSKHPVAEQLPFAEQVKLAMRNLLAILRAAGCTRRDILKLTAYIAGVENWSEFNSIYAEVMGDAKPARTVIPVPALHYGYLIEVEAVARIPVTCASPSGPDSGLNTQSTRSSPGEKD